MRRPFASAALAGALIALAVSVPAQARAQAPSCTTSFHVLHDDRIGSLQLPAGTYELATTNLSCAKASHLFVEFLEDFNGVLPGSWRSTVEGVGHGRFIGSRGRSFTALRTGSGTTGGGGSHGDLQCPGVFEVDHDDRIGALRIPEGGYTITLLGGNLTCATAERYFRAFLKRPLGNLPRKWVVLPQSAEFMKFSSHHGFRIKPAVG